MNGNTNWIKIIHIAKNKLGLDDIAYRAVLEGTAGVSSAKEIKTTGQYLSVMAAFKKLGFSFHPSPEPQRAPGMISEKQEYYIRGLWDLASRAKDEKSLRAMIKRISGVSDIAFLKKKDASKVILALREIARKAGFNPDSKEV